VPNFERPFFEIPVTKRSDAPNGPTPVPLNDLPVLRTIPKAVSGIVRAFHPLACEVFAYSDRFRVYVGSSSGENLAELHAPLNLPSQMALTASELAANAAKSSPLPLAAAVTSISVAGLLRCFVSAQSQSHLTPTFTDETGVHPVPTLSPQLFVGGTERNARSRSGSFKIVGAFFAANRGLVVRVTDDLLDAVLPKDLETKIATLRVSDLQRGVLFEGTLAQDVGGWHALPGGTIVVQAALPEMLESDV